MRIRQVKPDFFRDGRMADLPDSTRLVYIGLWMEADDTGWLRYDITEIAADLYPYHDRTLRETMLTSAIKALADADRLRVLGCGHAFIPTLVRHQRFASETKRVVTFQKEHETVCVADARGNPRPPATVPDDPRTPAAIPEESRVVAGSRGGKERNGSERNGQVSAAAEPTVLKDMTTKKKPQDEELLDSRLAEYADPATPESKKDTLRFWLSTQGVHDPEAEIAQRGAAA